MIFHVFCNGDPSVGINGDRTTVEVGVTMYDGDDRTEYIKTIKEELSKAFSAIWDDKAHVMTQEEIDSAPEE